MIKKQILEYDETLRSTLTDLYLKTESIKKVHKHTNLSRNEILAILLYEGVSAIKLKSSLASTNIHGSSFIVISDTHIGSFLENPKYLEIVYDFALKNGIRHIFHAGDILQSTIRPVNPKYVDVLKQSNHLVNVYPSDKKIINHILLGNHDFHAIEKESEVLEVLSSRKDFDILGFKKAYFTWNNYLFSMSHDLHKYQLNLPNIDSLLRFVGHRHSLKIVGDTTIFTPTLSDDIKNYGYQYPPGFLLVRKEEKRLKVHYLAISDKPRKIEDQGIVLSKNMSKKYQV